ncbi:unnamed protein product [Haemonchus placei]|uniref:RepB domain-containing protein n=1 Tax=Haemonchus placei TaxID=6290 RepID=A0A0N4WUM8_HAEPC|nr:unnamed protein product [Haemonchus placei]
MSPPGKRVPPEAKPEELAEFKKPLMPLEKPQEVKPEELLQIEQPSPKPVEVRAEKPEKLEVQPPPRLETAPPPRAPKRISPPQEPQAVPMQAVPFDLGTAKEIEPPFMEAPAPRPSDRLRVNIDEILRLGAIMERRQMSTTKKLSFEWIALNRHIAHLQPEAFSSHLATAVGDVRLEKSLACDALNVLLCQRTITPDEYIRLCQHLDSVNPITISTLAQLLRTNTVFYNTLQTHHRQTAGVPTC